MTLAALQKAESLARFAKGQGAPLSEYVLTLTAAEAFELLDFIGSGGLGWFQDHVKLVTDIAVAKATNDPWTMLEYFELEGFAIRSVLH